MKKILDQFAAPTPSGWKKAGRILSAIAFGAGMILAAPATLPIAIPAGIATVITWIALGSSVIAAIIAGRKTISPDIAEKMKTKDLSKIRTRLIEKENEISLNPIQRETLEIVRKELSTRVGQS